MATLVIVGASGDLARRLLLPALFGLERRDKLGELRILGYALEEWREDEFAELARDAVGPVSKPDAAVWARFARRLSYRSGDLSVSSLQAVQPLGDGDTVFYLALPPGVFAQAASALGRAGLGEEETGARRLVIEKPFGTDLASAEELNAELHRYWREDQVLRIDHFLGKETVQNLLVVRFANRMLEPLLCSAHVDQVQITVAETLGLEGRYRYYDAIGALRDMVQNHLLQLLCLATIEPPALWDADVLRDHKVEILKATHLPDPSTAAARGQYTEGVIDGRPVSGYRAEPGIRSASTTETFAALRLFVDTWRWKDVPFYVRSGKRLAADTSEIAFRFRRPPTRLFRETPLATAEPNWLVFRLGPPEGIDLFLQAKQPGLELEAATARLHADYNREGRPEAAAYEQLLLDAINGDTTPFLRFDEVEWAWRLLDPVVTAWRGGEPAPYASGTEGPATQDAVLQAGHRWRPVAGDAGTSCAIRGERS